MPARDGNRETSRIVRLGLRGTAFVLFLVVGASLTSASAASPSVPALPPIAPRAPTPAPEAIAPPYEAQIERLAELMGTLAYLRRLCGESDAGEWHDKMTGLLEAEAKTSDRKLRLAGSYNQGFSGYQLTHRTCTAASQAVIKRSLGEGERLAHELSMGFDGD